MKIRAEVRRNTSCQAINNREIDNFFSKIGRIFDSGGKMEISVVFIDDDEMRKINKKWRQKDKTTDVLSFSLAKDMGEILISCPQAKKQAKEYGISEKEEIKRLILHGTLHLMGYKHEQMKKIEKKISYA